jgi:hypothetical protein
MEAKKSFDSNSSTITNPLASECKDELVAIPTATQTAPMTSSLREDGRHLRLYGAFNFWHNNLGKIGVLGGFQTDPK